LSEVLSLASISFAAKFVVADEKKYYLTEDLIGHPGIVPRIAEHLRDICSDPLFRTAESAALVSSVLSLAVPSLRGLCLFQEATVVSFGKQSLPKYAHELTLIHEWNILCDAMQLPPFSSSWGASSALVAFLRLNLEVSRLNPGEIISTTPFQLFQIPSDYADFIAQCAQHLKERETEQLAVCLFCGQHLFLGPTARNRLASMGPASMHARRCCGGVGLVQMVSQCIPLAMVHGQGYFLPTPYLDQFGEQQNGLRRGRILTLNTDRYDHLRDLIAQFKVGAVDSIPLQIRLFEL
jgi:hypothetical protein